MQSVFFILEFLLVPYDLRVISSWKFIQSSSLLWRFDFSNCGMKMLILESVMTMGMWKWMWTLWMLEEDEETYLIETPQQSIYAHIMDNSWHLCKLISLIDRDNLGFGGENVLALNSSRRLWAIIENMILLDHFYTIYHISYYEFSELQVPFQLVPPPVQNQN